MLCGFSSLGKQWEKLPGVAQLHSSIPLFEAQMQSLWRQILQHHAELEAVLSEASGLEVYFKATNWQTSACRVAFNAVASGCDQIGALVDAELRKYQNFETTLVVVRGSLDNPSSLLRSGYEMLRYDLDTAYKTILRPFLDALWKRTSTFYSVASSQFETYCKTLPQSAFSIISSLDQPLSFCAPVSH